jgi:hypothetical protein
MKKIVTIVLSAASTYSFTDPIRPFILHEEKLSSILEGLKATLTDNRVGVLSSKFSIFVVG